jgi:adenylate cyclase
MADVFISYARPDEGQAERVAEALRQEGYRVWRDDELPAHRAYADVIEERLKSAKAVIVLWSAESAKSQWVRSEANVARSTGTLIQANLDASPLRMPFDQIQCADLSGWDGSADTPGWRKLLSSVAALAGPSTASEENKRSPRRQQLSICVLPFVNMSGDAEQEYFSDGITEDITTDLSKVSALDVIARNTAFNFKGSTDDAPAIARKLGISHVLEGSVRKAGNRVRITAQLIDGHTGAHLWADRYDRDLTDIFAIQDEISHSIVDALKVRLLPEEKKAIEQRGTTNVDAYNLYLMARQYWTTGNLGSRQRDELIARICQRAVEIDPNYAGAWALLALAQTELRFRHSKIDQDGIASAERALALDPAIPEVHSVKARYLAEQGRYEEAGAEVKTALRLDPDSWEVNREAARFFFREGRMADALACFKKAGSLLETDCHSWMMAMCCCRGIDDSAGVSEAAKTIVERAQNVLAHDQSNGMVWSGGALALATLGQLDRAREWMERAILVDPDNRLVRYNAACAAAFLNDADTAIDLLAAYLTGCSAHEIKHVEVDPDLKNIRDHPRFIEMLAQARERADATSPLQNAVAAF